MVLSVDFEFPTYPNGFPDELMEEFLLDNNLEGFLGNKPASGTQIIEELGNEHMQTGYPNCLYFS